MKPNLCLFAHRDLPLRGGNLWIEGKFICASSDCMFGSLQCLFPLMPRFHSVAQNFQNCAKVSVPEFAAFPMSLRFIYASQIFSHDSCILLRSPVDFPYDLFSGKKANLSFPNARKDSSYGIGLHLVGLKRQHHSWFSPCLRPQGFSVRSFSPPAVAVRPPSVFVPRFSKSSEFA